MPTEKKGTKRQRQEFNPERMRALALSHFERGKLKRELADAQASYDSEIRAIEGMEKINEWLGKKKIKLRIKKEQWATYYDERNEIVLSGGMARERQLVFLIHECGHVLIGKPKRTERFGMTEILAGERCTFRHRVDVVDEEFEAWHRGWKLAKKLGIKVDRAQWDSVKTWALVSYLKWAVRDADFNDGDYSDMRMEDPDESARSVRRQRRRRLRDEVIMMSGNKEKCTGNKSVV